MDHHDQPDAIVVGSTFGAVYAEALAAPESPMRLAALVATGSARSTELAARLGVPLFTDLDDLPEVGMAVVVVRSGIVGGTGSAISARLLERGIHVLQEQPVHTREILELSKAAAQHGAHYAVNDFYGSTEPARQYIRLAQRLSRLTPIRYAHARCAVQVAYPLFTMLAEIIPRLVPAHVDALPAQRKTPFAQVRLTLDDVPVDLLIDNTLCAEDPDSYMRLSHEITIGTDAGELTLTHTHGSTVWRQRRHHTSADHVVSEVVGRPFEPTVSQIYRDLWPEAVRHAATAFVHAVHTGRNPMSQRFIRATELWTLVTSAIGPPTLFAPLDMPSLTAMGFTAS
ncbi:Gfo/Idh/MocA family oxidoreductase [Nocardia sp. BSTN01]|uniref:Gfo/Idh/MocA family oxidoreductase n=1 Tax=Nocardia sp. BSTN01 TaxID=2783665 RepID=UPI001890473B|nr:Gfo/Idh/MocA family oxidoreductase [Nocardia sp. BSTN01]MBF4998068.1 Gfo/Idh/MocA family oxidoreductase [Nocardia sp. BSTN01]